MRIAPILINVTGGADLGPACCAVLKARVRSRSGENKHERSCTAYYSPELATRYYGPAAVAWITLPGRRVAEPLQCA